MMESLNRWAAGRAFLFVYSTTPGWNDPRFPRSSTSPHLRRLKTSLRIFLPYIEVSTYLLSLSFRTVYRTYISAV